MGEIVNIQIGQGGNQTAIKFWELVAEEHGIDPTGTYRGNNSLQLEKINVFFKETSKSKYTPRTILVDLEPSTLDTIRAGPYGKLYQQSNYAFGNLGSGNSFANAYYNQGAEIIDYVLDIVRNDLESCDRADAVQIFQSLGGGTGTGLGSLAIEKIKEEYFDIPIHTFSIFPSPVVSDCVVEPYSAVLGMHRLIENVEGSTIIDNEALFQSCFRVLKISTPTYGDLNRIASSAMCGITSCLRFPTRPNYDFRKFLMNLTPFPRLHFFTVASAPLSYRCLPQFTNLSVPELIQQVFRDKNRLCTNTLQQNRTLGAHAIFRGRLSINQVEEQMSKMKNKNSASYVDWIPDNMKTLFCDIPTKGFNISATVLSNSTVILDTFKRMEERFTQMSRRKAFMHGYCGWYGMDQLEFYEAQTNFQDLLSQYQQLENPASNNSQNEQNEGEKS